MKKWIKLIVICIILLLTDVIIKRLVFINVAKMSLLHPNYPYGGIGIFRDFLGISFSINYVQNPGAAWGAFSGYTSLLFYLRIIITIFLIGYLFRSNPSFGRALGFCLIITGALGNIIDYIVYGHVVDMFYFTFGKYSYPVFNLADSLITVGILWLIFSSFFKKTKRNRDGN